MVRTALVAALTVWASAAVGQTVDWSGAGGGLFSPEAEESALVSPEANDRVAPLSQPLQAAITEAARRHGLDEKLLHALVIQESAYDAGAVSSAGAAGLTQLMPATARELGVSDRFDPVENLNGGAAYLARQINRFQDLRLALAAYNAGPARVAKLGRVPEIAETRAYVAAVIECYLALSTGRTLTRSRQCQLQGGAS
ncbi:MAG: lytic transglycosylase domain-containing protein [Brevundimonas sp.]